MIDIERHNRQIKLEGFGEDVQRKLSKARVLLIGVGGLGCPVAQYLTAAGIGTLGLIDHDIVSLSNLHRQILFTEEDIGKPKVKVAQKALQKINSTIQINSYLTALTTENALEYIEDYDLIIDGTDNFQSKYLIDDACLLAKKPWVYASIFKNEGQISIFNYQNGPTFRCLFPNPYNGEISCEATGVLGVLPGLLGVLQATEAIKLISKKGTLLSGILKIINPIELKEQSFTFQRNNALIEDRLKKGLKKEAPNCALDAEIIYLDVREAYEEPILIQENIIHIPLNQLDISYEKIPLNASVYVFCQSGVRSRKAIDLMQSKYGFHNLINVEGGVKNILNNYAKN